MQKREEKVQILSGWNYQENLQEEHSKDLHKSSFPWSSNKYFIFRFPNVNTMQQLFKGKFAGGSWGCNIQGFWLIEPWIPQAKPKFPKELQILQESKDNLTKQKERGGRGGNPLKGTISENLHSVCLTYEEEASPPLMIAYPAQTATWHTSTQKLYGHSDWKSHKSGTQT